MPENNSNSRLQRIESTLEKLIVVAEAHTTEIKDHTGQIKDHTAQINSHTKQMEILLERRRKTNELLEQIAAAQLKLVEAQNKREAAQFETTEKLDALIRIVDEWIRNNRPQSGA